MKVNCFDLVEFLEGLFVILDALEVGEGEGLGIFGGEEVIVPVVGHSKLDLRSISTHGWFRTQILLIRKLTTNLSGGLSHDILPLAEQMAFVVKFRDYCDAVFKIVIF